MGDAYGRRMYQRPQRQEWMDSPPQYYASPVVDHFGMAGSYMGPGMARPGNMGPPMLSGAFQHQPAFHIPPPGPAPNSSLPFRPSSSIGVRGPTLPHQTSLNSYMNHQSSAVVSPLQG